MGAPTEPTEPTSPTSQVQLPAAREQLLAQHAALRDRLQSTVTLARRHLAGELVTDKLAVAMTELGAAFEAHNDLESTLLEPLLLETGSFGPARLIRMLEEHADEHTAFTAFLARPLADLVIALPELVDELEAHMAAEERTFLSAAVARLVR